MLTFLLYLMTVWMWCSIKLVIDNSFIAFWFGAALLVLSESSKLVKMLSFVSESKRNPNGTECSVNAQMGSKELSLTIPQYGMNTTTLKRI